MATNTTPVWSAHSCCFYDTRQDLLDIVVPYFKDGMERREFCFWVIPDSLSKADARAALAQAVPGLGRLLAAGRMEFVSHDEWYLEPDGFDAGRLVQAMHRKLEQALASGNAGLRASGDAGWLADQQWADFIAYERKLNEAIPAQQVQALCTYPLAAKGASHLLDVACVHRDVAVKHDGKWETLLRQTPAQNRILTVANTALKNEVVERESAESQLIQQKEILQTIFDHLPLMIGFMDQDNRIRLVNREWESTLGWTLEEIQRDNLDIFAECCPDAAYRQRVLDFIAKSDGDWVDFKAKVRSGRVRDIQWSNVRLSDGTRIGMGHDMTDRRHAEEALRDAEETFRQLTEKIEEFFWIKTPDFRRVLYLSPNFNRVTGIPCDLHLKTDGVPFLLNMIHPDDRLAMAEIMQRADGKEFEIEFRFLAPDGSVRWIRERGFPILDTSGKVSRIAGLAENITERKLAEERLKASSDQLRALSASLQSAREEERARIAREIHDELGSSLTILKWDLEGLETSVSEVDSFFLAPFAEKTSSLINLTDSIINTVRRIASDLRPSILDDIGLVEAIEWQAQQFQARTGIACLVERGIEECNLTEDQSTAVFRIFQEALTNVLRHAQANRIQIVIFRQEDTFILSVADNGRGITDAEKCDPLALGLLGMRERAHLAGGQIGIDRIGPHGTMVTVRIPPPAA